MRETITLTIPSLNDFQSLIANYSHVFSLIDTRISNQSRTLTETTQQDQGLKSTRTSILPPGVKLVKH